VNKGEFVDKLATRTGLTKKDARKALDAMIDLITDTLVSNDEVLLTGFGKFEVRARKESKRINPQTQKRITVPKKVVPAFKPGKNLKDIVAKKLKAVKVGSELKVKKAR
jgi:DNA-binding protein HU-beta